MYIDAMPLPFINGVTRKGMTNIEEKKKTKIRNK